MIYVFNINIPETKKVAKALEHIPGIGKKATLLICSKLGIGARKRFNELDQTYQMRIRKQIERHYIITNDMYKEMNKNINNLLMIKCFRGYRHLNNQPVRGQRSHSNARTQKRLKRHAKK